MTLGNQIERKYQKEPLTGFSWGGGKSSDFLSATLLTVNSFELVLTLMSV